MDFTVLSSGSKGNCLVVRGGGRTVMVEAGLGPRTLKARMASVDVDPRSVSALFVTHGHHDHVKAAPQIAQSMRLPTFATAACARERSQGGRPLWAHQTLVPKEPLQWGHLKVTPFATPHDAPGSVGLVFDDGYSRLGVVTDLGCVTKTVVDALMDLDMFYVEFNYNLPMLMAGPYSWRLKQRIKSNVGHLSNEQGAELLAKVRGRNLRTVVLAHLSESNNTPEFALEQARPVLDGSGVRLMVAPQRYAMGPMRVATGSRDRSFRAAPRPRVPMVLASGYGPGPAAQLSLFQ